MQSNDIKLSAAAVGDVCRGFRLVNKQYVESKAADLYTLRHEKTGAELLYFDRSDENKTFSVAFKTMPEDSTGVFHILEHSVLNGSRKFPVKEPFVSMLQSSMQTFLNAMTYSDKTVFPVSSRNEQDLFNLMEVYLDAVFCPAIYDRPEIFMQEGWHYEFKSDDSEPYFNGVVFSEMKGVYADVDRVIADETERMLFPDTSYGFISGGHPDNITDLTYEKFIATHKRFYHPSNARIFLDGHMDVDAALALIDDDYLSKYDRREPDFDFVRQTPKAVESTLLFEPREGEEELAHLSVAKILCDHDDVLKIYAAKVLADYLTGSNEAPLKRAFLEKGLAQDISLEICDGIYQPFFALVVRNTSADKFDEIKAFIPEAVKAMLANGLNRRSLTASLERFAFVNREISEPYGVELAVKALDGWLYGDDPLTHIDNAGVFVELHAKLEEGFFEALLDEMLGSAEAMSYLSVLPSTTKAELDAKRESDKIAAATAEWSADERARQLAAFKKMQQWQQTPDTDDALAALPHLALKDVPVEVAPIETAISSVRGCDVLEVNGDTNGIVYLNLYFDVSDFTCDELRLLNVMTAFFGELRTEHYSADELQTDIKATLGGLELKIAVMSKAGDTAHCKPYLLVGASMLKENVTPALELIREILLNARFDEADRIAETVAQSDYFLKQSLIGNGHVFAISKALSAFSSEDALKETLEGESFVKWFADFAEKFGADPESFSKRFAELNAKAFTSGRLFAGFGGELELSSLESLIAAIPDGKPAAAAELPVFERGNCAIEIPSDVGYSALGNNLYAMGRRFTGACSVLGSLMTFGYLWNAVRVQGGAYGTGMSVRANGDVFCYSYRDPNLKNSLAAFGGTADFLQGFLAQGMPLDDIIIGTVNQTDPLLDPSGKCDLMCARYLRGTAHDDIARIRREILSTSPDDLAELIGMLRECVESGRFCAVGNRDSVAFVK